MLTDTQKMEHVVGEHSECVQNDLLCILNGLDDLVLDMVCEVIVDRTNVLIDKLKQFTEQQN